MKWFKHYENAHTNTFIQALLKEKDGLEMYARWFLLLEFLCGEFKKDTVMFIASSEQLKAALRVGQDKKLGKILESFRELSAKFDESLLKVSETSEKFYKFETPIILELMGKSFKRTRPCRGSDTPKKEEERKKNKNIYNRKKLCEKSCRMVDDYNLVFGKKLSHKTHVKYYKHAIKLMTEKQILLTHKTIKDRVDSGSWTYVHQPVNLFGSADKCVKRLSEVEDVERLDDLKSKLIKTLDENSVEMKKNNIFEGFIDVD
jgi:hypothetical protein